MINLENILEMWKIDCEIKSFSLDETTLETAKLHSKYIELLAITKLQVKKAKSNYDILYKNKYIYYNGKMDKETIDSFGWKYDPFNGLTKPLKGEMELYYKSDTDLIEAQHKIEYLETIKETLEEIINTLRWRHQNIRNILEFRKFEAGI